MAGRLARSVHHGPGGRAELLGAAATLDGQLVGPGDRIQRAAGRADEALGEAGLQQVSGTPLLGVETTRELGEGAGEAWTRHRL